MTQKIGRFHDADAIGFLPLPRQPKAVYRARNLTFSRSSSRPDALSRTGDAVGGATRDAENVVGKLSPGLAGENNWQSMYRPTRENNLSQATGWKQPRSLHQFGGKDWRDGPPAETIAAVKNNKLRNKPDGEPQGGRGVPSEGDPLIQIMEILHALARRLEAVEAARGLK